MSFGPPPPPPTLTPPTIFVAEHLNQWNSTTQEDRLQTSTVNIPNTITISSIATHAHLSSNQTSCSAIVDALLVPTALATFTRATLYRQSALDAALEWRYIIPPIPAVGNHLLCRTYINSDSIHFASNEVSISEVFDPRRFRIVLVTHLASRFNTSFVALAAKLAVTVG